MSPKSLTVFFGLILACSLLSISNAQELDAENDNDDLETAEFLFWPKLFLAKAALGKSFGYTKTIQINTVTPAPVVYSYRPVTYTAYKWVPVPYQYTVQQPYIDTGSSSDANTSTGTSSTSTTSNSAQVSATKPSSAPTLGGSANVVVRAPGVNVDIVKTGGLFSVDTGVGVAPAATGSSLSSPSSTTTETDTDTDTDSAF